MGGEIILHATATGKAWLATLPENDALRIVCERGFEAASPLGRSRCRNVDDLRRHLKETRRRGFATSIEEGETGTVALAVAFHAGPQAGTLSVAGPKARLGPERFADIADALHAAACEIERLWPLRRRQSGRLAAADGTAASLLPRASKAAQ